MKKYYSRFGYDKNGFDLLKIHKDTKTKYNSNGYDFYGFDENGFDENGFHKDTKTKYNLDGYNREGYTEKSKRNYSEKWKHGKYVG